MRKAALVTVVVLMLSIWIWQWASVRSPVLTYVDQRPTGENSPVCPWRDPQRDLTRLFPAATTYTTETRILSRLMATLDKQLRRPMTVDENPLRIHRAGDGIQTIGSVLVKRVKGEHGGVELVTGIDVQGRVCGVIIQSHREPGPVALIITNWLPSFVGKTAKAPLLAGDDLPQVAPEARRTADAIAEGVRTHLIVLSFADAGLEPVNTHH